MVKLFSDKVRAMIARKNPDDLWVSLVQVETWAREEGERIVLLPLPSWAGAIPLDPYCYEYAISSTYCFRSEVEEKATAFIEELKKFLEFE